MQIINFLVSIFTCIGIIIAILEFYHILKSSQANNERNQKQATLEFYLSVKDELYTLNHLIYDRYKRDVIPYNEIEFDEQFVSVIKNYLNTMEVIATAINTDIYNIYVFDRLYGDVCVRVGEQMTNYIESRRKIINEPEMYMDYEILINKLKSIHEYRENMLNPNAEIKNKYLC